MLIFTYDLVDFGCLAYEKEGMHLTLEEKHKRNLGRKGNGMQRIEEHYNSQFLFECHYFQSVI